MDFPMLALSSSLRTVTVAPSAAIVTSLRTLANTNGLIGCIGVAMNTSNMSPKIMFPTKRPSTRPMGAHVGFDSVGIVCFHVGFEVEGSVKGSGTHSTLEFLATGLVGVVRGKGDEWYGCSGQVEGVDRG